MAGQVRFTPDAEDYVAASRANFRLLLQRRRFWLRTPALLLTLALVVGLVATILDGDWMAGVVTGGSGAVGGIGMVAICVALNYALLPGRARRLFAQQRALHHEQLFRWDEAGTETVAAEFGSRMPWRYYHGWIETPAAFLLYFNEQMPQFLPRRALDAGQIEDLRATLVAYGPPRR
jgi:hypothetical protein